MSQFFVSGAQSIGTLPSSSVLPVNIQEWFPLALTGFYLFAVQGTLKSLLWHHSSKASILQHSPFFMVQLLHPYTTTGKTIALTRWTFVGKVMSLLFNMLSRLVISFLPRSIAFLPRKSCSLSQHLFLFSFDCQLIPTCEKLNVEKNFIVYIGLRNTCIKSIHRGGKTLRIEKLY